MKSQTIFSNKITHVICVLIVLSLIIGCAANAPKKEFSPALPSFQFTPPSQAEPGSADVTLGMVNPSYAESNASIAFIFKYYPFNDYQTSMANDFEELLLARGFTTTGPFHSRDEMTYPEKNGCDLTLTPIIDISADTPNLKYGEVVNLLGPNSYKLWGEATVKGRITLNMFESLSGEKMWTKSFELPSRSVNWQGEKRYASIPRDSDISDPALQRALGSLLQSSYDDAMNTAWRYLDPQEIQTIKKQALTVKDKKRY